MSSLTIFRTHSIFGKDRFICVLSGLLKCHPVVNEKQIEKDRSRGPEFFFPCKRKDYVTRRRIAMYTEMIVM